MACSVLVSSDPSLWFRIIFSAIFAVLIFVGAMNIFVPAVVIEDGLIHTRNCMSWKFRQFPLSSIAKIEPNGKSAVVIIFVGREKKIKIGLVDVKTRDELIYLISDSK
jgi:hypothetical protein